MQNIKLNKKLLTILGTTALLVLLAVLFNPFGTSKSSLFQKIKLNTEKTALKEAFSSRFLFLNDYEFDNLVLLNNSHIGATLKYNSSTYRTLFVKEGDSWKVYGIPSLILNYSDYPDIPRDIIKSINNM